MNNTVRLFDIQRSSFHDGPGIRTTVFFKGCNLRCAWCHNPESQNFESELMLYKNRCTECGKCKEACPSGLEACDMCGKCAKVCIFKAREICGKEYSLDAVIDEILKDKRLYDSSGGGVTFSGGECMLQIDALESLLKQCKMRGINTAVDSAGNLPYKYFERILEYTDLFLYDIKLFDSKKHEKHTGVTNELILENLNRLLNTKANIWIRIPIISEVNDTEEEMKNIKDFLSKCKRYPERVELLPYHNLGEHKYEALRRDAVRFFAPSEEKIGKLKSIFK